MDVSRAVLQFASQFFCPKLESRIAQWELIACRDLGHLLQGAVLGIVSMKNKDFVLWPTTVSSFFHEITPAFNTEYMHWRAVAYLEFQDLVEEDGWSSEFLRDTIIREHDLPHWVHMITQEIAIHAMRVGRLEIPQLDGPSTDGSAPLTLPTSNSPITQIRLSGPTLKQAWNSDPILRQLEHDCPGTGWSPAQASGLPVYHGTNAQFGTFGFNVLLSRSPFSALRRGFAMQNQMAPTSQPVLYTDFSPLRCYLWALFKSEVIRSIPN